MSEKPINTPPPPVNPAAEVAEIVIQYSPVTGDLRVKSPPDAVLAHGMLSVAAEIINSRTRGKVSQSNIITPRM